MTERGGGCLCGALRYSVRGALRDVIVCHCVECRRSCGGPWPATAARRSDLTVTGEVRWIDSPRSASAARRGGCPICGALIFWDAPGREIISFGVGTLEDATGLELAAHIYVGHAQGWERVCGDAAFPGGYPSSVAAPAWRAL